MTKRRRPITEKEVLEGARKVIAKPDGWLTGRMSKFGQDGKLVAACMLGSVQHSFQEALGKPMTSSTNTAALMNSLCLLRESLPEGSPGKRASILKFNEAEGRKQSEVVQVFDIAIAKATHMAS